MTLRRATILAQGLLAVALVACAGWLIWISVTYAPDLEDPWPIGPGVIALPMAVVLLVGAAAVAIAARLWMRSGNRSALMIGDLMGGLAVALAAVPMPAPLAIGALLTLAVAGATVAANKPAALPTDAPASSQPSRSPVAVLIVIVAAVVVGVVFVAPILANVFMFAEPID